MSTQYDDERPDSEPWNDDDFAEWAAWCDECESAIAPVDAEPVIDEQQAA